MFEISVVDQLFQTSLVEIETVGI